MLVCSFFYTFSCAHFETFSRQISKRKITRFKERHSFNFNRFCQFAPQSSCTDLNSHQQCLMVLLVSHCLQHAALSDFLIFINLISCFILHLFSVNGEVKHLFVFISCLFLLFCKITVQVFCPLFYFIFVFFLII